MDEVTINIKATMRKEWVDAFAYFLNLQEYNGAIGHSEYIAFFSDGDGTFNPKFEITDEHGEEIVPNAKNIQYYSKAFNEDNKIFCVDV